VLKRRPAYAHEIGNSDRTHLAGDPRMLRARRLGTIISHFLVVSSGGRMECPPRKHPPALVDKLKDKTKELWKL